MISIDTSCGRTSMALFSLKGELLIHYVSQEVNNQSRELAKTYLEVTDGYDIEKIFVCIGPGSFTGVRIGCAFAAGIISSSVGEAISKFEVVGFTSLELIAASEEKLGTYDAICKAGPHSYYKQKFNGLEAIGEIEVLNTREILDYKLPDAKDALKLYKYYKDSKLPFRTLEPIYALPSYYS